MTRQAIETRTRLLIARDILNRVLHPTSGLEERHYARVSDAFYIINRAVLSLEPLDND